MADMDTFVAMQELVLDWLRGDIPETPWYMGPPDPETSDLLPVLIALTEAGCVTTHSQPGMELTPAFDGRMFQQRAQVSACMISDQAKAVAAACREAGLSAHAWPAIGYADAGTAKRITITEWGGERSTSIPLGCRCPLVEFASLKPAGFHVVAVIDEMWGRNDVLWPTILTAVTGPAEQ